MVFDPIERFVALAQAPLHTESVEKKTLVLIGKHVRLSNRFRSAMSTAGSRLGGRSARFTSGVRPGP